MGEFEFIENIRRAFEGIGDSSITGIGDDCAVLSIGGGGDNGRDESTGMSQQNRGLRSAANRDEALVVTTDMLVEGVHFLRSGTSARELGAKALAVNLSDVAAMGARPVASFLSIALPAECHGGGNAHGEFTGEPPLSQPLQSVSNDTGSNHICDDWAAEFMEGYRELSVRHGVRLAGGDTTSSLNGVAINVTAIGRAPLSNLKYRAGARVGDIVVVGGPLGESAAGLRDILEGRPDTALAHVHRNPTPQVEEGAWLGTREEVHSMIDLSDGLASDLVHILRASGRNNSLTEHRLSPQAVAVSRERNNADGGLCAEIELTAIPTPVSLEQAVAGGEDYKLLFTVAAEDFERLAEDYLARFGEPLHPVGRIAPGAPEIRWLENGRPVAKEWRGFTHF